MEKPAVTVKFQELPGAAPLSADPPPPAFRARAFTTGSLWEILSRARSSPTHGLARWWVPGHGTHHDGLQRGHDRQAKVITDYVHLERRHRQRHWSEFDAGGVRQRDNSVSNSPSSTPVAGHCPNAGSKASLKYSRSTIPKPHEVQLRVDPRITAARTNPNRNSLLINAYLSSSLHCLSKRRAQSAPTDTDSSDYLELPEPFSPYWKSSTFTKGLTYLGDSLRSISRHRKSSLASNGSDDEQYGGGLGDECLTPGGTFNVSSASSLSVPSYRIGVVGRAESGTASLIDNFMALGDADDDDVFVDDDGGEKNVFITIADEEYYLAFSEVNEELQDLSEFVDMDAHIILADVTEGSLNATERALQVLSNGGQSSACILLLSPTEPTTKGSRTTKEDIAKLAARYNGLVLEFDKTSTMETLEQTLAQIKKTSSEREEAHRRNRKYRGLSMRDMPVDKQTLFNRFFRRTLSTKSCDNLLAL